MAAKWRRGSNRHQNASLETNFGHPNEAQAIDLWLGWVVLKQHFWVAL